MEHQRHDPNGAPSPHTHRPDDADLASAPAPRRWLRYLTLLGPAFIAGAWQFGPGALTTAVQAGTQYGHALIWVIVISTVLAIVFTDMSVRVSLRSRGSLIETTKQRLGRPMGVLAGVGVFAITLLFSVGNAAAAGLSLSFVFGGSAVGWTLACTVAVALIILSRNLYTILERLMLGLVALMALGFVLSAVLTQPHWLDVGAGFVPTVPAGAEVLLIALVGTNFSMNAAFYIGYATRERGLTQEQYRATTFTDTIPGIAAPGIMAVFIIVAAATTAGEVGTNAGTLPELAVALEPAAGPAASWIFALGFFGAAFSSMIANASAGGTLLADGIGLGNRLASKRVKALIMLPLTFGALVTAIAGEGPVELIVGAQALIVLIAPLLGVVLFLLANQRRHMSILANALWQNVLAVIGILVLLAMSAQLVITNFG
ncbi:Mn2+/Fe2+ NRAMP family transporter [Lipingzhangella halophila]|uniref:Mn2+/Fe2+ NRAMP family transporter n=1 Tax=Lipingzhangella halophila TaxID=1783352 RepID=A0A7W7RPD3_9ACTN|nr:Nramp family divalent metal transporter [Lipingzhangella halophila]MBB4935437.1 Mn2+/Fe2+ NRAMP family transporter [Lipingzhangella halophila]